MKDQLNDNTLHVDFGLNITSDYSTAFPPWSPDPKFSQNTRFGANLKAFFEKELFSDSGLSANDIFQKLKQNNDKASKDRILKRPNTATRQHLKKISEEFCVTQNRYETLIKNNFLNNNSFGNNWPHKTVNLSHRYDNIIKCTKCISRSDVSPSISTPHVSKKVKISGSKSIRPFSSKNNSPSSKYRSNSCSAKTPLWMVSPHTCNKVRKLQDEICVAKPIRRRISFSAKAGLSGYFPKIPFEQVKKAKKFTENSVLDAKVFSIHGNFPPIREAMLKRGWVEKQLTTFPYINPHPQNCVCAHVGWHITTPSIPHHHAAFHSPRNSDIFSAMCSPRNSPRSVHESVYGIERKKSEEHQSEFSSIIFNENLPPLKFTEVEVKERHYNSDIGDENNNSKSDCEEVNAEQEQYSYIKDIEVKLDIHNSGDCTSADFSESNINNDNDVCQNQDKENVTPVLNEESLKRLSKTINTKMLGPAEIREGIQKSINLKNLSIFQYSVPIYVKPEVKKVVKLEKKCIDEFDSDSEEETITEDLELFAEEIVEGVINTGEDVIIKEPYNPFPELKYILTSADKPVISRVLRNVEPNFLWTWNKDSISFKHLSKDQLVNHFPNTPFTTKYGLCDTLKQMHWFSEAASVDTFVPRGFCIGHEDERAAFIEDYRTTACLDLLKRVAESADDEKQGILEVIHPLGEVPIRRVRQALQHIERFIECCCHDDIDSPPISAVRNSEWEAILNAHQRIIYHGKRIKAQNHHAETLLQDCQSALERVEPFWPQLQMDGIRNVWIVKPGAQSRGRGIFLLNNLEDILGLVQSPMIYQTKYVVQKYMERPLLIHNRKFDIRQWFMVTDWNPLTIWMYRESYVRFCSRDFDLTNSDESIHLSNNAIQCKYMNGKKENNVPQDFMWDNYEFEEYLRSKGHGDAFDKIVYEGMKKALVATMLAAQVQMESFKYGFEFFGADFMLTEDLRPWLIEINSSPCMAATTNVTRRMCADCLQDIIRVVIDYKQNKEADTGKFEMIYRDKDKSIPNPPYLGVNLQIWKNGKPEKRKYTLKPIRKGIKSLPMINLKLESCPNKP